ncbi:hypothetical protein [Aureimonas glaciei]|uniref:Uncharacterized protein n=1 Tax=Aureimonas glaciei TaxID=1776957 RepID=A0A917DK28_9HYPH|nr:hypothetical protein [Aureimonas glaciei]GGD43211.1 hypothetical protein GCM10011335_52350 [Aureimonas glaciei]
MALILGIDGAQKTGFCFYDDTRSMSAMRPGLIKATGEQIEDKAASIARQICLMIRKDRPDFIAIEEPLRTMPGGVKRKVKFMGEQEEVQGGAGGTLALISSNQIVGAIAAVCAIKDIPFVTISSSSWRKQFLGFGRSPGLDRTGWKKAARDRCAALKITVTSDDAAEACGIAFAATATPEFKMLRHQKEKAA